MRRLGSGAAAQWRLPPRRQVELPTTKVKQGRVIIAVSARGELQGGNSEMLAAPMAGGGDLAITHLRGAGEVVKPATWWSSSTPPSRNTICAKRKPTWPKPSSR